MSYIQQSSATPVHCWKKYYRTVTLLMINTSVEHLIMCLSSISCLQLAWFVLHVTLVTLMCLLENKIIPMRNIILMLFLNSNSYCGKYKSQNAWLQQCILIDIINSWMCCMFLFFLFQVNVQFLSTTSITVILSLNYPNTKTYQYLCTGSFYNILYLIRNRYVPSKGWFEGGMPCHHGFLLIYIWMG